MSMLANRTLVGLGLFGSLAVVAALLTQFSSSFDLGSAFQNEGDPLPFLRYCLTLFAAGAGTVNSFYALTCIDRTGISYEGRVTATAPIVMAGCVAALIARWMPEHIVWSLTWLALAVPGVIVGFVTPTSNLAQSLRRTQSVEDEQIGFKWELKQLANRVSLLQQLTQPGGPDPLAQKKLNTTGNSLQKYHLDTKKQLEDFLQRVEDDAQRASATNMLQLLLAMNVEGS